MPFPRLNPRPGRTASHDHESTKRQHTTHASRVLHPQRPNPGEDERTNGKCGNYPTDRLNVRQAGVRSRPVASRFPSVEATQGRPIGCDEDRSEDENEHCVCAGEHRGENSEHSRPSDSRFRSHRSQLTSGVLSSQAAERTFPTSSSCPGIRCPKRFRVISNRRMAHHGRAPWRCSRPQSSSTPTCVGNGASQALLGPPSSVPSAREHRGVDRYNGSVAVRPNTRSSPLRPVSR